MTVEDCHLFVMTFAKGLDYFGIVGDVMPMVGPIAATRKFAPGWLGHFRRAAFVPHRPRILTFSMRLTPLPPSVSRFPERSSESMGRGPGGVPVLQMIATFC